MYSIDEILSAEPLEITVSRARAHKIAAGHGVSAKDVDAALHGRTPEGDPAPSIAWHVTDNGVLRICLASLFFWLGY